MLPDNTLSTQLVKGNFNYPDNLASASVEDYETGGIALSDTSEPMSYQVWRGWYDSVDSKVRVKALTTGIVYELFTEAAVQEFSFCFDQNMRWCAVTRTEDRTARLRWYDAATAGYVISGYSDVESVKLALDDKRKQQIAGGVTDIIFTYLKTNGNLCWRVQRERFLTEHVGRTGLIPSLRITNFGMTNKHRMQWRLSIRNEHGNG